jgi:tetratricopeptide (TPR) repeat protein
MAASKKQKLLQKADGFARDHKVKKAINLYRQAIQEDPNDIRTRLRLSELLYQAERGEEALEVLQFVGDYYREHGFLLKSVAVYKKMLEVDPSRSDLHGTLAQLYFQLGMAPDAIRQFKAQIRAMLKQDKVVDSLHVVRSMLELDPANVFDRVRLAENFSKHGLIDEAANEYLRVLGLLEKNGKSEEWGKVALRYLHHTPDDFAVRKRVTSFLIDQGDYQRALQHLYACLQESPQDLELLDMVATSFDLLGQPGKAIVALKSVAAVYKQKGLANETQDVYTRILQLDPKDEVALKALDISDESDAIGEAVELEWDLPEGMSDAEVPPPLQADDDTIYEPPSFADDLADEATLVQAVDEDLFKELLSFEEEPEPDLGAVDVLTIRNALDSAEPMTPDQLKEAGVALSGADEEELDFFISSGLTEEALAILKEIYDKLLQGE